MKNNEKINNNDNDDLKLVEKFKEGEKSALQKIYFKYKEKLSKLIWYYVKNIDDVEDVLQILFLKLIKKIYKYTPYKNVKFSTWLYRVTVNTAKDYLKTKSKDLNIENYDWLRNVEDDITEKIEERDLINQVRKKVFSLPLKYREVIILVYFENLSYKEVAQILKKPIGTIKSRVNYALGMLKKNFNKI